jgi:hypothetical protein
MDSTTTGCMGGPYGCRVTFACGPRRKYWSGISPIGSGDSRDWMVCRGLVRPVCPHPLFIAWRLRREDYY